MSADSRLDLDGELLPIQQYVELCTAAARWSRRLAEHVKQRVLDSDVMNDSVVTASGDAATTLDNEPLAFMSGADGKSLHAHVERDVNLARLVQRYYQEDPVFSKVLSQPRAHQCFGINEKLIWMNSQMGRDVI